MSLPNGTAPCRTSLYYFWSKEPNMKEEAMFYQADEQQEITYNDIPYRPLRRKHKRQQEQDWEQEPHDNLLL